LLFGASFNRCHMKKQTESHLGCLVMMLAVSAGSVAALGPSPGAVATVQAVDPTSAVTALPVNTIVAIRTIDLIDSNARASDREYAASLDDPLVIGNVAVAQVGTPAFLRVVQLEQAGAVRGRASLSLRLVAIEINGQRVALETGDATIGSGSQAARATKAGVGGAIVGGIIGGLLGGNRGAAQGAAAGAAAGVTAAVVAGQRVQVPAETRLSFTLTQTVSIQASSVAENIAAASETSTGTADRTSTATAPLTGLTEEQVRATIGAPSLIQQNAWIYDTPKGTLRVQFENGVVSEVRPADFDLAPITTTETKATVGSAGAVAPTSTSTSVVALPVNTAVAIRTVDLIDSNGTALDREYLASLDDPVVVDGVTVASVGAPAFLRVVQVQGAGAVRGRASLSVQLVAIEINGQRVVLETGQATIQSGSQAAKATKAGAGAAIVGGILGGLFGGAEGAAKGAAAGAAAGVTAAAVTGQRVRVPAETRLSFTLTREAAIERR